MMLLQADSFIHEPLGLVGAMTEEQAKRAVGLVKGCRYERVRGGHVIHQENPGLFVKLVTEFATTR